MNDFKSLPAALQPLVHIAMNLRWAWDQPSQHLFRLLNRGAWQDADCNPLAVLAATSPDRFAEAAADEAYVQSVREVGESLGAYISGPRWFQSQPGPLQSVAYLSPEFGVSEALPQYSGGLGVLAGDHLKAASDLGIPLVAVGLMYRQSYFSQSVDKDGWQHETYTDFDPGLNPVRLLDNSEIEVEMAGERVAARIWRADVGRVRLYLLDSNLEENSPEGRTITDRLYGGDREHRIRQEILLGIGGIRALRKLNEVPQIFHINEGHAGFSALERIREAIAAGGSFDEALELIRTSSGFTTHTSVPAGIDLFDRELMEKYFGEWVARSGIDFETFMALGHDPKGPAKGPFNMAMMCLRLAGRAVGVSKLHGSVSRQIFHTLWPEKALEEVPIGSVTNGVHARSWVAPPIEHIFGTQMGPAWDEEGDWGKIHAVPDLALWEAKSELRRRLVDWVRVSAADHRPVEREDIFDPDALTLGFARRFAGYKRPTLLLSRPERLRALVSNPERPVQIVVAGKAHPADDAGKRMIQEIIQFSREPEMSKRIAFLPDYHIGTGRVLFQGSDVWLNNPLRPLEACGTSGEKAAFNGSLNLSIPDGWWDEMFDGENGWGIPSADETEDPNLRNDKEADALFDLLENEVVPLFYDRGPDDLPVRWLMKMKHALASLGPQVSAYRMLKDYLTCMYEPLAANLPAPPVSPVSPPD